MDLASYKIIGDFFQHKFITQVDEKTQDTQQELTIGEYQAMSKRFK